MGIRSLPDNRNPRNDPTRPSVPTPCFVHRHVRLYFPYVSFCFSDMPFTVISAE